MKEELREAKSSSPSSARCMSPSQVKHTLSKLDKDGDTRRNAMNSLKQRVEAMDASFVPRFLVQVSETKGSSRAYAISLYEDVARVHGKLIIPHIPRVMSTVTKSLSSSGSSPQLQQACAKVLSTVAKHATDDSTPAQASDVLTDLCEPLIEVLAGKLEPLAAGAAVCLQTLVESEKWQFASDSIVQDLILKTAVALAEKGSRTASHMQLARSLAVANPSLVSGCGVAFLRSGVEVLKAPAVVGSWQQRASAARLLTAVLPIVDRATIAEELCPTLQALEGCQHDRMSNVRWSVKEALKAGRGVLAEENLRRSGDGEEILACLIGSPEPSSSSPRRRSSLGGGVSSSLSSDDMMSSPNLVRVPKAAHSRGSPVSSVNPLSPSAPPPNSPRSRVATGARPGGVGASPRQSGIMPQLRSPLKTATSLHVQVGSQDASSFVSVRDFESPRKENWPSHDPELKMGSLSFDSGNMPTTCARQRPAEGGALLAMSPPSPKAAATAALRQCVDMESSSVVVTPKGREENHLSPPEQEGDLLAEDEEVFLLSNYASPRAATPEPRHAAGQSEMKTPSKDSPAAASRSHHGVLDGSTMKHVFELKGPVIGSVVRESSTRSLDIDENGNGIVSPSDSISDWIEPSNGLLGSPCRADSPPKLRPLDDFCSPQEVKPLLVAEDFLSFTTPRRLVRSLQESFVSPQPESPAPATCLSVTKLRGSEDEFPDMDLGTPTSTGTGWSVRTNPIASDESNRTDSDDSDHEQGRAVWKKMVLESSIPSPTPPAPNTPPAQETDNPDINDGFRHRLKHPASASGELSALPFCELNNNSEGDPSCRIPVGKGNAVQVKPELPEEVEIIKRAQQQQQVAHSPALADGGALEGLARLLSGSSSSLEDDDDNNCCSETRSPRNEHETGVLVPYSDAPAAITSQNEQESDAAAMTAAPVAADVVVVNENSVRQHFGQTLREFFGRGWSQGRSRALLGWQVCAIVVAIPLAITLSKVAFLSDPQYTEYLVPT